MAKVLTPTLLQLQEVLARWDAWLAGHRAIARMFSKSASNGQIWWTGQQLGKSLPPSLRSLMAWHNGETRTSRIVDRMLREYFSEVFALYSHHGPARWMNHLAIAREGLWLAQLNNAESGVVCRRRSDDETSNAALVPFIHIPLGIDETESKGDDDGPTEINDGDWILAVDTLYESVWLFESDGEELEGLRCQAPNLAAFWGELLALLETGKVELPAPVKREEAPAEPEKEAIGLVRLLIEKEFVALASGVDMAALHARVAACLREKRRERARDRVVKCILEDDAFEDVFAEDDVLRLLIEQYI